MTSNSEKERVEGSERIERPKTSKELLERLSEGVSCEVADTHAFKAAKYLEEKLEQSFTFQLSKWNKGWAGFSLLFTTHQLKNK